MLKEGYLYEFGPFRLDPVERLLLRDGKAVPLTPKAFELLLLLVENSGHLLRKDGLMQRVWPDAIVEEVNLAQNISAIRRALCAMGTEEKYIETVPKGGYRFTAPTHKVPREGPSTRDHDKPAVEQAAADQEYGPQRAWARVRHRANWLVTIALLTSAAFGLGFDVAGSRDTLVRFFYPRQIHSVVVLPLENLSADTSREYFAEGMTDALITDLARIRGLRVISRTSAMRYRGTKKSLGEIASELKVDAAIEGTVTRSDDRVRLNVQLIDATKDHHLWAESYERDLRDVLSLQNELAHAIAVQVRHELAPGAEGRRRQVHPEAYENYLKGRFRWNERTEAGLRGGIKHFHKAIELDPAYAQAYAGLADSYIMMANWGFMAPAEAYQNAEAAARKALQLDNQLAEARASLAYATFLYRWDWAEAEKLFRSAIELNPSYATAHHFYSVYLMAEGRHAEAQSEIRRAQELDPLSLIINSVVGWIYYEGRRYDQAIEQCQTTVQMDPSYAPALLDLGTIYLKTGEYQKAIAQFERARTLVGDKGVVLSYLAQAHALSGDKVAAKKILRSLESVSGPIFVSPWDFALIHLALGNREKSLSFLEQAVDQHVGWVVRLGVDPALDGLRAEARFTKLERRVGVPRAG